MLDDPRAVESALRTLLDSAGGLAAGLYRVEPGRLVQVAFLGPKLAPEVAREFAAATLEVPLDRPDFGIVRAYHEGVAASHVETLPPKSGSGGWLRRFGAERSVAVAIEDRGSVVAVLAVAIAGDPRPDDAVAAIVRTIGEALVKGSAAPG